MKPTNIKKKCSASLVIREMQIKTTLRFHLMPVRMAIIKKSRDNRCKRGCGEIGILLHCWWECKLVQPLWKTVWPFLKDLEIEIPFDLAIPLLGIYPKDYKSFYYKDGTHGHGEGSITHWGLSGGIRGGTAEDRELGGDNMGINARYR